MNDNNFDQHRALNKEFSKYLFIYFYFHFYYFFIFKFNRNNLLKNH